MNAIVVAPKAGDWGRLKALVLDSVSSPITRRVYNLGLDEFFQWYGQAPRPGFTKAAVSAWRVALEARGLGSVSINVRITAVRKLAAEAADNGLLAPDLAGPDPSECSGCIHQEGVTRPGDLGRPSWLRSAPIRGCRAYAQARTAAGGPVVHRGPGREARARAHGSDAHLGQSCDRLVDLGGRLGRGPRIPAREPWGPGPGRVHERKGGLAASPTIRNARWCPRHRGHMTCAGPARSFAGLPAGSWSRFSCS